MASGRAPREGPDRVYRTPTYWWPENRAWCVCANRNPALTLLGGAPALVEAVARDDGLGGADGVAILACGLQADGADP